MADPSWTPAAPTFGPNSDLPRHRWYRFKEGYSAGVVRRFVQDHTPGKGRLIDPFLGSGTTAVEGMSLGRSVDGIEINPFMTFVAKVKTRDYSSVTNLEAIALRCLRHRERNKNFALPNKTTLVERDGLSKWLLNRDVARRFEELRTAIARITCTLEADLLLLALISCIEDVANARKDGKCWRYKRNWQRLNYNRDSLDSAFASQVIRFAEDIRNCPKLSGGINITHGDARQMATHCNKNGLYDGLLTSPPYLNSFDYTDIYRPELLLLNAARGAAELRSLRLATVRSHVQVAWATSPPLGIPLLRHTIASINRTGLWNDRIPEMVNAYFVDLDQVIQQCARQLKFGSIAGIIIAESAYAGVVIPVGQILAEIFKRRHFLTTKTSVFRHTLGNGNHQQRSGQQLKEVMILAEYRGPSAD
jgi:DNA modification methylase